MNRSWLGWTVLAVLAAGVGIYALSPGVVTAVLPYALLAACPVSMLLMMKLMHGDKGTTDEGEAGLTQEERLARMKAQQAALDEEIGTLEREELRPSAHNDANETYRRVRRT
ncbi:MAG TPA: DUF2933 domain-containing protein [Rubrobacter sp.]|nr:DUF2933 domain-containing protein [Rubrobacter sp.]